MHWEVRLNGDDVDLQRLVDAPACPEWTITVRDSVFFLGGSVFDHLSDPHAVREKAQGVVAVISGALRVSDGSSRPIEVGHVVKLDGDGKQHFLILADTVLLSMCVPPPTLTFTRADGTVERHRPADPAIEILRKASLSEAVRRVLALRSIPDLQLRDLANILEVIKVDKFPLTKAEKRKAERVDASANHWDVAGAKTRHAASKQGALPRGKWIELNEAREVVEQIIHRWLDGK